MERLRGFISNVTSITMTDKMKKTFVFGGGSSLGSIEVGMLKALVERDVIPDFVVGTSAGALNATYFAQNPTLEGVLALEKIWKGLSSKEIFPISPLKSVMSLLKKKNYLIDPKGLHALVNCALSINDLSETKIPTYVVTTDILSGEEVVFNSGGPVKDILSASAAIPGIYPPVKVGNHLLVDGGIVNNTPISTAIQHGATQIIVLTTGFTCDLRDEPKSLPDMMLTSYKYMQHRKLATDVEMYKHKANLRIIPPLCPLTVLSNDFSHGAELIDRAYIQTVQWLDAGNLDSESLPKLMRFHTH